MVKVLKVVIPKYDHPKYLTEGEPYCQGCYHHAEYCQCPVLREAEVTEEELGRLRAEGKVL
jgi:hypothetical protein